MKNWISLEQEADLDTILAHSIAKPQIIFKDSVTCGISAHAKERLMEGDNLIADKADFHYLDLLKFRTISNLIAQVLDVTHQSPQIIVVRDKKVVYTASHHAISPANLLPFL